LTQLAAYKQQHYGNGNGSLLHGTECEQQQQQQYYCRNPLLMQWVQSIRQRYKSNDLCQEQINLLTSMDFSWDEDCPHDHDDNNNNSTSTTSRSRSRSSIFGTTSEAEFQFRLVQLANYKNSSATTKKTKHYNHHPTEPGLSQWIEWVQSEYHYYTTTRTFRTSLLNDNRILLLRAMGLLFSDADTTRDMAPDSKRTKTF
jgi:hypothetical protein